MKLDKDGFFSIETTGEVLETYNKNKILARNIPESYRRAIAIEDEATAAQAFENLVSSYEQQLELDRESAECCVATNLANLVTGCYPKHIVQRVMNLYPMCRSTSAGRSFCATADPVGPDIKQLEKIMDCEDKDWEYFRRIDPPTVITSRDFLLSSGGLHFAQTQIDYIDSISIVDCETGEEMLKPPSESDISSWSQSSTPYVVELRSDDNEPLTVEWLNSVRPARSTPSHREGWPIGDSLCCYFDIERDLSNDTFFLWICFGNDTIATIEVKTRGEVRAICRALKAEVPA